MGFIAREIEYMIVKSASGDLLFEAKTGEDPEYKLKTGSIESSADGMTNTGQLIKKYMKERSYISGVFAFDGKSLEKLQETIEAAKTSPESDVPVNVVMSDGAILSNTGIFVGSIIADGPGTVTLRFESALDFIES